MCLFKENVHFYTNFIDFCKKSKENFIKPADFYDFVGSSIFVMNKDANWFIKK